MNKLIISTRYPETVISLLKSEELVERHLLPTHTSMLLIEVSYPDDCLSQALIYWLALTQGCGLINNYQFQERQA